MWLKQTVPKFISAAEQLRWFTFPQKQHHIPVVEGPRSQSGIYSSGNRRDGFCLNLDRDVTLVGGESTSGGDPWKAPRVWRCEDSLCVFGVSGDSEEEWLDGRNDCGLTVLQVSRCRPRCCLWGPSLYSYIIHTSYTAEPFWEFANLYHNI